MSCGAPNCPVCTSSPGMIIATVGQRGPLPLASYGPYSIFLTEVGDTGFFDVGVEIRNFGGTIAIVRSVNRVTGEVLVSPPVRGGYPAYLESGDLLFLSEPESHKIPNWKAPKPEATCTCSIQTLMIAGCKCGYLKKDK